MNAANKNFEKELGLLILDFLKKTNSKYGNQSKVEKFVDTAFDHVLLNSSESLKGHFQFGREK